MPLRTDCVALHNLLFLLANPSKLKIGEVAKVRQGGSDPSSQQRPCVDPK